MPKQKGENSKPNVNNKNNIRNVNDTNNTLTVNITCSKDGNGHRDGYKVNINGDNFKIGQTLSGAMVKFEITECDEKWNSKQGTTKKTIYYDVDRDNYTPYYTENGKNYMRAVFRNKLQKKAILKNEGVGFLIRHTYHEMLEKRQLVLGILHDLSSNDVNVVEYALKNTAKFSKDTFKIIMDALKYNGSNIELKGNSDEDKVMGAIKDKTNKEKIKEAVQAYADKMESKMNEWTETTEKKGEERFWGKEKVSELLNVLDKARLIQTENKRINVDYTNYAKHYQYNDFKPFNYQKKRFYTRNGLFDTLAYGFKSVANSIGSMMRNLYNKFTPKLSSWNSSREVLNLNTIREQTIKEAMWR